MTIIGIDPGTVCTGYGVIRQEKGSICKIASGVIRLSAVKSLPEKLDIIYNQLCVIIRQYRPDEFAIETAFFGKNVQSAMKIGYARGVALLASVHNNIPCSEYSPRDIKRSVTGTGAAGKNQVSYMVKTILQLKECKMTADESDALAVAICHSIKVMIPSKGKKDWKTFVESNPERIIRL